MMQDTIYNIAAKSLGKHLTLDPNVPHELGCAEAVSFILKQAGVQGIPMRGYASTVDLQNWLLINRNFVEGATPEYGGIIISATKGTNIGHVGIILKQGIGSNDSETGLFSENYHVDTWEHHFTTMKGLATRFFIPKC